jgi:hypothetical protein
MTIERPMFPPVDPSRRGFLAQAAAVAAGGAALGVAIPLPGSAEATERVPDPILAAIEEHRKADAAHLAAIKEADRLGAAYESITEQPCDDENEAFEILLGTAATTVAGLSAKISYLREIEEREAWMLNDRPGVAQALIESFAESIETIWGVQS